MSFAIPKRKRQITIQATSGQPSQRATSQTKGEQQNYGLNKSQEMKKGMTKNLLGSTSTNNLELNQLQTFDDTYQNPVQIVQANLTSKNVEQIVGQKLQKVMDRIGYLEDALSRVELQQDSMRPVFKMIESQNSGLKSGGVGGPTNINQISIIQNNKKGFNNKENGSNASSFISQANATLLEKLTKVGNINIPNISQDSSLMINQQLQFNPSLSKDDIEKMIATHIEPIKAESQNLNKQISDNIENLLNQIENIRQDVMRMQDISNANTVKQLQQQQMQQYQQLTSSPKPNNLSPRNSNNELASFKAQFADQLHFFKSKLDLLLTKVDSMDNSYDKRISNLEAVVTPILAQEKSLQPSQIQSFINQEFQTLINSQAIQSLIDERIRQPLAEKERQLSLIEKEITQLKSRDSSYNSNANKSTTLTTKTNNNSMVQLNVQNNTQIVQNTTANITQTHQQQQLANAIKVTNCGGMNAKRSANSVGHQSNHSNGSNGASNAQNHNSNSSVSHQKLANSFNTHNSNNSSQNGLNNNASSHRDDTGKQTSNKCKDSANHNHSSTGKDANFIAQQVQQQQKQQISQHIKKVQVFNNDLREHLEELESYILNTSETINERLEDIHRQMGDLHNEIYANIDLVKEKKRLNAPDTNQFVKILGEDVKQFIQCMRDEIEQVILSINERDEKCKIDMNRIDSKINQSESLKQQIQQIPTQNKTSSPTRYQQHSQNSNQFSSIDSLGSLLTPTERKEIQKIDAFKEHTLALQRHMDNTSSYLQKEVVSVDSKIEQAKGILFKELSIDLSEQAEVSANATHHIEKEIQEVEEEQYEDEDDLIMQQQQQMLQNQEDRDEDDDIDDLDMEQDDGIEPIDEEDDDEGVETTGDYSHVDEVSKARQQQNFLRYSQQFNSNGSCGDLYPQQLQHQPMYNNLMSQKAHSSANNHHSNPNGNGSYQRNRAISQSNNNQNIPQSKASNSLATPINQQNNNNINQLQQPFYYQSNSVNTNSSPRYYPNQIEVYDQDHENEDEDGEHGTHQMTLQQQFMVDDYGEELDNEIINHDASINNNNNNLGLSQMLNSHNNNNNINLNSNVSGSSGLVHYTNNTKDSSAIVDESEPHRAQKSPGPGQNNANSHSQFNSQQMLRSSSKSGLPMPTKKYQSKY
ncbi:UNKNOWN [Stylonychia lemnae]|uniref:Uncharacterized protein n=1 Tax=Stylonychia lemnae TaxID=5949 RepID=A0A078AIH6_STYLE|nr:UNKNOWN [Stylonychia lemnae]|eukprot:CDW82019.1 UNKNOWN [Stylonychia lemnae]